MFLAAAVACALAPITFDVLMQRRRGARVVAGPELYLRVALLRPLNAAAVTTPSVNEPSANGLPNKQKGGSTGEVNNISIMQVNIEGSELFTQTHKLKQNVEKDRTRKASLPSPIVTRTYSFNTQRRTSE